jgi:hypothetical protein
VQLQQSLPDLKKRGIGVAAISYDSPAILEAFAKARGITFPLLSDTASKTIARFGILNKDGTGRLAGIPHPGTFVLDARGVVVARSFEERYEQRATAGSLLARRPGEEPARAADQPLETSHLVVTAHASDRTAAPGNRLSLLLDVVPKPKMHVYAPEQKELIPISLTIDANDAIAAHRAEYPNAEKYFFAPLKETQLVYSRPFRVVQPVTLALTPALRDRAAKRESLAITGRLRYQACDDKVCYMPQELRVSWTIGLTPLVR